MYPVPMEEQVVRSKEQNDDPEGASAALSTPAPMVERAFRLLGLLSTSEGGLSFSELARMLHMSKGGLHGLLKTLESNSAIEQDEKHRYILGPRIYDLAHAYIQGAGLRYAALPAMRRLASATGETVCLGKIEQRGVRVIECIVGEEEPALHIAVRRGQRLPLLAGALGPCVLASWPPLQRAEFLRSQSLPRFTSRSITDPQQLLVRVEETIRTGVSFDHGEYLEGVNAVAAPIYFQYPGTDHQNGYDRSASHALSNEEYPAENHNDQFIVSSGPGNTVLALLWVVGFASRFAGEAFDRAIQQLHTEAVTISLALGK
jgi:DNA-binding IclR family transcriptional regulator